MAFALLVGIGFDGFTILVWFKERMEGRGNEKLLFDFSQRRGSSFVSCVCRVGFVKRGWGS